MLLLAAAIILFASASVAEWDLDGLYGKTDSRDFSQFFKRGRAYDDDDDNHYEWGTHAGWYLAMITFALIPLALLFGLLSKNKKAKTDKYGAKPEYTTTTTTQRTDRIVTAA